MLGYATEEEPVPFSDNVEFRIQAHEKFEREHLDLTLRNLRRLLTACESPLEQLLLIELAEIWNAVPVGLPDDRHLCGRISFPEVDCFTIAVRQQHTIRLTERSYRADFFITVEDYNFAKREFVQLVRVVVEVDGHDYHERTKEQARHDRRRDRTFLHEGLPVMRFTGSEIFQDAHEVALEINDYVIDQAWKFVG